MPDNEDIETIEVTQPLLGFKPYVLLELRNGGEGPDDIRINLQYGGGITEADIADVLLMTLTDLPDGAGTLDKILTDLETEAASTKESAYTKGLMRAVVRLREELGLSI